MASPEAESNMKLPDRTRAWRVFDVEIGLFTVFGATANQTANLKWISPRTLRACKREILGGLILLVRQHF